MSFLTPLNVPNLALPVNLLVVFLFAWPIVFDLPIILLLLLLLLLPLLRSDGATRVLCR